MSICNSVQLLFQLDVILLGFLLLSSTSVFQFSFGSGQIVMELPNIFLGIFLSF
jgi:hypothetical protein